MRSGEKNGRNLIVKKKKKAASQNEMKTLKERKCRPGERSD